MIRIGVVGLGKMGLSHLALINAHPETEIVACDSNSFILDGLKRYTKLEIQPDYDRLIAEGRLDAVIIATPSRLHAPMVRKALDAGLHVFCEKPFCLDAADSMALAALAAEKGLVSQVGYHYRYVGAFQEMKRVCDSGALGDVTHVLAEAYGPVVLRAKGSTWRTQASEGGGCLYDYAAHPINLVNWCFGKPESASGTILNSIFSADTDDEVYSTLRYPSGMSAHVSVNWSDESFRKMSTKITMTGTKGRLYADRQECQVFLREECPALPGYGKGWTVRYTTDLTEEVDFYIRGEEYSAQLESFVANVKARRADAVNSFQSAADTDATIKLMLDDMGGKSAITRSAPLAKPAKRGWFKL